MAGKWIKSKFEGVRYREHPTRKHGALPDRYFTIRFQANGKRREEGLGWASGEWTEKKAFLELEALKKAYKTGDGPTSLAEKREIAEEQRQLAEIEKERQEREMLTFGDIFPEYLEWAKHNKKHWNNDEYRHKKHLSNDLDAVPLKDISPFTLEQLKKKLQNKGLAPATVKHVLVLVRQVFNKAIAWGKFTGKNPIKDVKLPTTNNAKLRAITPEEEAVLMPALKEKSWLVYGMAMASLYSGLRFSEVAHLRWADIDLDHNRITVREGKGGVSRIVPLCKTLRAVLVEWLGFSKRKVTLVFPDTRGGIIKKISATFPRTVTDLKLNEDADKRFTLDFHSLRHSYATRIASAGTPLHVLRDLLGHADLQMVSRYAHLIPSQAAAAVAALDSIGKK